MEPSIDKTALRPASIIILTRSGPDGPEVLMGQRGKSAAFMPGKFVFPGGAVDAADSIIPLARPAPEPCLHRLGQHSPEAPHALLVGAIRELWEETGLIIGTKRAWPDPPAGWESFAETGHVPDAHALRYVFRAVTPPGRSRRFDARFLIADAAAVQGDPDDFSRADDELSHIQWIPLSCVRQFDLPFITKVVLAELGAAPQAAAPTSGVPFVQNDDPVSSVTRLV